MFAAGNAAAVVATAGNYIEDVFSTWLYTGNGSTQTITNGIDLSGKGGLVWLKGRDLSWNHTLYDTVNGVGIGPLNTASTAAPNPANNQRVTAFNATGFDLGTNGNVNGSGYTYASWTFRKQPKFFDVVTYTGTGSNTTIAHALGSVPGCIIVKRTDTTSDWWVYHRSLTSASYGIQLNLTNAQASITTLWNSTDPTSTVFSVGTNADVNASGGTYVAYLFAHNAGGFGAAGTDNVISCGSFTSNGSGAVSVTLSYEPQWVLYKPSSGTGDWRILDNMRGWTYTNNAALFPNGNYAEIVNTDPSTCGVPTATGFSFAGGLAASTTYIYIAIRRGPMKTPTDATKVFSPAYASTNSTGTKVTTGFPVDMQFNSYLNGTSSNQAVMTRLLGVSTDSTESGLGLVTSSTTTESSLSYSLGWDNTGFKQFSAYGADKAGFWNFGRAPGFFDVVCYTGTGSATTVTHNLGVAPELMIVKSRSGTGNWKVWNKSSLYTNLWLNSNVATQSDSVNSPTATTFYVFNDSNTASTTYVAYLFATVAGVSKVGSYTGTGTLTTINCGFTGGARFVLIKRTDSTGDWFVWDTARGMVAGTDPSLRLNSTAAESNANSVYTIATGFQLLASPSADVNTNGGSYIFLAIA